MIATKLVFGAALLGLGLSGCVDTQVPDSQPAATTQAKVIALKQGDIVFNYAANGKTYRVFARYDGILRAYGTLLTVVSGAPFTGATAEDREAQNTLRDAFRKQGVCAAGLQPGIIQFGYGYLTEYQGWGAKVRCSDKLQNNI